MQEVIQYIKSDLIRYTGKIGGVDVSTSVCQKQNFSLASCFQTD